MLVLVPSRLCSFPKDSSHGFFDVFPTASPLGRIRKRLEMRLLLISHSLILLSLDLLEWSEEKYSEKNTSFRFHNRRVLHNAIALFYDSTENRVRSWTQIRNVLFRRLLRVKNSSQCNRLQIKTVKKIFIVKNWWKISIKVLLKRRKEKIEIKVRTERRKREGIICSKFVFDQKAYRWINFARYGSLYRVNFIRKKGAYISNVLGRIISLLVQKRDLTPSLHW